MKSEAIDYDQWRSNLQVRVCTAHVNVYDTVTGDSWNECFRPPDTAKRAKERILDRLWKERNK